MILRIIMVIKKNIEMSLSDSKNILGGPNILLHEGTAFCVILLHAKVTVIPMKLRPIFSDIDECKYTEIMDYLNITI